MNVITRGIRGAFRNVTRTVALTLILGLSIGLALAMLVAHQAVGNKIDSVKSSVGNTVSISPAGLRGFEGGGTPLTQTELDKVSALPHVTSVIEVLSDRLTSSNTNLQSAVDAGSLGQRFAENSGQSFQPNPDRFGASQSGGVTSFTPPVTVNGTNDPTNLAAAATSGGGTFTLKSGKVFDGTSTDNVALLGTDLATKNNLSVGSTFTAYGATITVVGIFDAGNTFANNQVVMPLATVQKLSNQVGNVTSAIANIDSVSNVSNATTDIKNVLGSTADVTNSAEQAQATITPLENIQTISLYSLIGAVVAGAVIILMTMIMIVRERRREIGVIKAIGASNWRVARQFMVEAVTLTMLAAIVGIGLGFVAANPITNMLVTNSSQSTTSPESLTPNGTSSAATRAFATGGRGAFREVRDNLTNIHAVVGWDIILYGLGAAIVIAVIGSGIASAFISKVRPAEVMRTE